MGTPNSTFDSPTMVPTIVVFVLMVALSIVLAPATNQSSLVLIPVAIAFVVITFLLRVVASLWSGRQTGSETIEITTVRVMDDHGDTHECRVVGAMTQGTIRAGDRIKVVGRRCRNGTIRARRIVNLHTETVVKTSPRIVRWIVFGSEIIATGLALVLLGIAAVYIAGWRL